MASSSSSSSKSFDTQDKCTIPINSHNSNNNGMNSKKKQNYGSLRKDLPIQEQKQLVNIKHRLTNGDTLQGISLKYGVSVGIKFQIKIQKFQKTLFFSR